MDLGQKKSKEIELSMKKYLICYKAGAGCDYSIGCGIKTEEIEAPDLKTATALIHCANNGTADHIKYGDDLRNYLKNDDRGYEEVWIYEIKKCSDITNDLKNLIKIDEEKSFQKSLEETELAEKETYLKLKEKYEGKI